VNWEGGLKQDKALYYTISCNMCSITVRHAEVECSMPKLIGGWLASDTSTSQTNKARTMGH